MKLRFWLLIVLSLAFCVYFGTPKVFALSDWQDINQTNFSDSDYNSSSLIEGNMNCISRTLKVPLVSSQTVYNPDGSINMSASTFNYQNYNDSCMGAANGMYMSYFGEYVSDSLIGNTIPFYSPTRGSIRWLPGNTKTALNINLTPYSIYTTRISINYNFLGISTLRNDGGTVVYKPSTVADYIRYADGSIIDNFDGTARSSNNGEFLLLRMYGGQMLRVNTRTKEITPFAHFFTGVGSGLTASITNDGRYVFVGQGVNMYIYDLVACQAKYANNQMPFSVNSQTSFAGCTNIKKDVRTLSTNFSDASGFWNSRFDDDGTRLMADAYWRDNSNQGHWKRAIIKSASHKEPAGYLAMGDSFASGEGDNDDYYYEAPTNTRATSTSEDKNLCHLSRRSYSYRIASILNLSSAFVTPEQNGLFHSVACSGAKTYNISTINNSELGKNTQYNFVPEDKGLGYWQPGFEPQSGYLNERVDNGVVVRQRANPKVITLSVGGNDAGFAERLAYCILPNKCAPATPNNTDARSIVAIELANLKDRLQTTYTSIKRAAPESRVYVIGYPQFVSLQSTCGVNASGLDSDERIFIRETVSYFNRVIASAAAEAGVTYVDVEDILEYNNLCSGSLDTDTWVNGATFGDDIPDIRGKMSFLRILGNESFHPNEKAQSQYASAILLKTSNLTAPMPTATKTPLPIPNAYFGAAVAHIGAVNSGTASFTDTQELHSMISSLDRNKLFIDVSKLLPFTTYKFFIHSTPTYLGEAITDQNGNLSASFELPNGLEQGYHELHMKGSNIAAKNLDYYQPVFVASSDPNDTDGDGIANDRDKCLFVPQANQDYDKDGIDDGCDGFIAEPPKDTTPPTVTGSTNTAPNENGWFNQAPTIDWVATETGYSEGPATTPAPTTADQEGEHTYTSSQSCDPSGNCATGQLTVKLDTTAPSITPTYSSQPNSSGWFNQPVTVSFSCSDETSGIADCQEPTTVTTDGELNVITATTHDKAGNETTLNIYLKLDQTKPSISYNLSPAPNNQNWFSQDFVASFVCSDESSGIEYCSEPQTIGSSGVMTAAARDLAGNESSVSFQAQIDKQSPSIVAAASSAANTYGWHNQPFTISFECSDEQSGVASCPAPISVSNEGEQILTGTVTDNAGNSSMVNLLAKLDLTTPTITPSYSVQPNSSGVFTSGVTISFSCYDGLSGIAACPNPVTITTNGSTTLSVTVVDKAGNSYNWTKTITIQAPQTTTCTVQLVLKGKCAPKDLTQCKTRIWPKSVCNSLGLLFEILIRLYSLYRP
jgi:lysophospholipase L1-like esterase